MDPRVVIDDKKNANGVMRLIGKVMELTLGYGGAVGAFTMMGVNYGLELSEEEIVGLGRKWRKAHPATVTFWYDVEWAARQAIRNPGQRLQAGCVTFDRVTQNNMRWLRVRLPSGRYLCYPNIDEREDGVVVYDGINQYTKQWGEIETYGPKIVENIVQAVARDILAFGMRRAEKEGYTVCLHVHDELITETPDDCQYTEEELSRVLATNPPWTLGLPLAAAGFETHRYRKIDHDLQRSTYRDPPAPRTRQF